MTDRSDEPRGLTLADLMVLVAGVALAYSLPSLYPRPALGRQASEPAALASAWLTYLSEQAGKIGLALGLTALARCARYGRPIRAPEFLALGMGWFWVVEGCPLSPDAWLNLLKTEHLGSTRSFTMVDLEVYRIWHVHWFAAGCVAAACLAIRPIRSRLPPWFRAVLLLATWQGVLGFISCQLVVSFDLRVWEQGTAKRAIAWVVALLTTILTQLPLAYALLGLRGPSHTRWSPLAWSSLALGLAAFAASYANQIAMYLWRSYPTTPEIRRLAAIQGLLLPAAVLPLVILSLNAGAVFKRSTTADRLPPEEGHPSAA